MAPPQQRSPALPSALQDSGLVLGCWLLVFEAGNGDLHVNVRQVVDVLSLTLFLNFNTTISQTKYICILVCLVRLELSFCLLVLCRHYSPVLA